MFATAATLALFGFSVAMIVKMARNDGQKIVAALQGHSWTAERPLLIRPVTIRFSQRYPASRPVRAQPAWRAAA